MRHSPLNAALCLITSNQLAVSFLCSLGLLILCLSASWFRLALFSGHLFFGAGNSERCLNQFLGKREVKAVGSISILTTSFWACIAKIRSLFFKSMSHFSFLGLGFCLRVNAELILVLVKRKPLKLKHNKAFKRDSCRVAFLVCGEFCGESGLRKVGLCGTHPLTRRYVYFWS